MSYQLIQGSGTLLMTHICLYAPPLSGTLILSPEVTTKLFLSLELFFKVLSHTNYEDIEYCLVLLFIKIYHNWLLLEFCNFDSILCFWDSPVLFGIVHLFLLNLNILLYVNISKLLGHSFIDEYLDYFHFCFYE